MSLRARKIAQAAFASVLAEPAAFAAIALPWFVIDYLLRYVVAVEALLRLATPNRTLVAAFLIWVLVSAGILCAHAGFVVAWTRWVILRQPPASRLVPQVGRRELRCAGIAIAIGTIIWLTSLPIAAAALIVGPAASFLAVLASALIGLRLCLAVSMAALDGSSGLLRASWGLTQGSMLPLFLAAVMIWLPLLLLDGAIGLAAPDPRAERGTAGWYLFGLARSAVSLIGSALTASAAAFALTVISETRAQPVPP